MFTRGDFESIHQAGEKGVSDPRNEYANAVGFHAAHLLRDGAWLIIELFHCRENFFLFIFSDIRMIVQEAGDRRHRQTCFFCYVFYGCHDGYEIDITWA